MIKVKAYIYQIECLATNKSYIGQTIDFNRRKRKHLQHLRLNTHVNPKLQNAWNKYGEQEFHFRVWEFEISSSEELDSLECEYIEKYNSIEDGYNIAEGGGKPPSQQKINNEDIIKFLCYQWKYGSGYGKTFEEMFKWAKGTAYCASSKKRYLNANLIFEKMSDEEKTLIADEIKPKAIEIFLSRQQKQGGCKKAYTLTQEDFYFAFAAQLLGYSYTPVANYLEISPATVKDWFNGRSRKSQKEQFNNLSDKEKSRYVGRVKTAELSGNPKSISSI